MNDIVLKIEYEKGDIWHNSLVHEYNDYMKSIKPDNHIHAYLVYTFLSTACAPAFSLKKDKIILVSSLMQDQNKPFRNFFLHKSALQTFGVLGYCIFILIPIEFITGIYQCIWGYHNRVFEYGFGMILLKGWRMMEWTYVVTGFCIPFLPEHYWPIYFHGLKNILRVDNYFTSISSIPLNVYDKLQDGALVLSVFLCSYFFFYFLASH